MVLEEILLEIEKIGNIQFSSYTKPLIAVEDVIRIIRSHIEDEPVSNPDKLDDGWIPWDKKSPPDDGTYLCTFIGELCGIDEPFTGMCTIENGVWDEPDCILAWQPLPDPYLPKQATR